MLAITVVDACTNFLEKRTIASMHDCRSIVTHIFLKILRSPAPQRGPISCESTFNIQSIRVFRIHISPPARIQVYFVNTLEMRAPDPLVHEVDDGE